MSADIHEFPGPNATDLSVLGLLSSDRFREAAAGHRSWHDRMQIANNLICDSLHRFANRILASDPEFEPKEAELAEFVLLALHVGIADLVAASGAVAPECDDAARLFALSADPEHRRAARAYTLARDLDLRRLVRGSGLDGPTALANMTDSVQPGLGEFYRQLGDRTKRPAT